MVEVEHIARSVRNEKAKSKSGPTHENSIIWPRVLPRKGETVRISFAMENTEKVRISNTKCYDGEWDAKSEQNRNSLRKAFERDLFVSA